MWEDIRMFSMQPGDPTPWEKRRDEKLAELGPEWEFEARLDYEDHFGLQFRRKSPGSNRS